MKINIIWVIVGVFVLLLATGTFNGNKSGSASQQSTGNLLEIELYDANMNLIQSTSKKEAIVNGVPGVYAINMKTTVRNTGNDVIEAITVDYGSIPALFRSRLAVDNTSKNYLCSVLANNTVHCTKRNPTSLAVGENWVIDTGLMLIPNVLPYGTYNVALSTSGMGAISRIGVNMAASAIFTIEQETPLVPRIDVLITST